MPSLAARRFQTPGEALKGIQVQKCSKADLRETRMNCEGASLERQNEGDFCSMSTLDNTREDWQCPFSGLLKGN